MTQLATIDAPAAPAPAESAAIIQVIERAAVNPAVDIDKMERLLAMQERIFQRGAEQAFNAALNAAQAELGPVAADANNPQTKSRYASYGALNKAIRPVYARHGFALSFDTGDGALADHVRVVCYVSHADGHSRTYHVDMPADGKGAKGGDVMTKTHATGAAMSYGQRYLLKLIFNIAVGDDDDGNGAGPHTLTAAQEAAFATINAAASLDDLRAWKRANAAALEGLTVPERDSIIALFNRRFAALKGGAPQ